MDVVASWLPVPASASGSSGPRLAGRPTSLQIKRWGLSQSRTDKVGRRTRTFDPGVISPRARRGKFAHDDARATEHLPETTQERDGKAVEAALVVVLTLVARQDCDSPWCGARAALARTAARTCFMHLRCGLLLLMSLPFCFCCLLAACRGVPGPVLLYPDVFLGAARDGRGWPMSRRALNGSMSERRGDMTRGGGGGWVFGAELGERPVPENHWKPSLTGQADAAAENG